MRAMSFLALVCSLLIGTGFAPITVLSQSDVPIEATVVIVRLPCERPIVKNTTDYSYVRALQETLEDNNPGFSFSGCVRMESGGCFDYGP